MTLIADIRSGLKARLDTVAGLKTGNGGGEWPEQIVPPAAMIKTVGGQYEQTFGADREKAQFEIHVALALKGGIVNAQKNIETYLSNTGASSIRAAIAGDRSLGATVHYTHIRGWRAEDTVEINGSEWMGAIIDVEVEHA